MASKYAGKKREAFYGTGAWLRLRVAVLQRDNYWCQICKRSWANTVHHIIPIMQRPDLALDADNCEACCSGCHNRDHPEKGEANRIYPKNAAPATDGIRVIEV